MLEVRNLHARIGEKEILKGVNLVINDGETHAIMGPNGSGKSTLSAVLVGNPLYEVTEGEAWFNGKNLLEMKPEDRAHEGLFLSFQYPVEIPGVSMTNFMKAAINEKRKAQGLDPMNAAEFLKLMREKRKVVELDSKLANRSVNEGFSGGEKKRNEIFQMAMLEPKLSILDETDSGLDVDAMRIVAEGVNKLQTPETSCIVITHYDRLLEMKPEDRAHEGLFLSFQYPVEIPGVSMTNFMKAAINEKRKYQGLEPLNAAEFLKLMREKRKIVELDSKLANRSVNEGFSGGEKKRNEIFQMAMLEPKLSILDETDSGLDVDAMRIVAEGVNKLQTPESSCIVITHYDRLLEMIKPQYVHVLYKGRIVKTGGPELAVQIQEHGYDWIKEEIGEE